MKAMKSLSDMALNAKDTTWLDAIKDDPEKFANEERRLALRYEIKRKIAGLSIKRQRISEIQAIVNKLNEDSDAADEEHANATERLQSELDELDEQHISLVLEGKSSPTKSLERRTQILSELAGLTKTFESRLEANRRSVQPCEKQIAELRKAIVEGAALESQLQRLSSSEAKRKMAFTEFDIRICDIGLREAARRHEIHAVNLANSQDWDNKTRRGIESSESAMLKAKLEESNALLADRQQRLDAALEASNKAVLAAQAE
jgi:hypothetical protein